MVSIGGDTITLDAPDDDLRPGILGLEWPGGYARADGALAPDGDFEVRGYRLVIGELSAGDTVRFDKQAFFDDPLAARGVPFTEVTYESPLGPLVAWHVAAPGDTWMIYVHGKASDRGAGLRILPTVRDAGIQSLIISYRNHESSPDDPTGRYQYGLTEWRDLEGAVRFALGNGAESIVLAGWSMGGGIVASFMYESALAGEVDAIILDSPVFDFEEAVNLGAEQRSLPGILTTAAKWVADRRFGIDWAGMDYLERADELRPPILIIHGDEDETVPISTSQKLADIRPDIVTLLRVPGASHTSSWNAAPDLYEQAVADFLANVDR
ncbi:MAG: alpha/beta hydrolase [Chloroflexi bacterium]|nr:alpha/beta hydrolase [Chloroflexota bacterium]